MRKILLGATLVAFALAPAMGWADCDYHEKASMASAKPAEKAELAQAPAANKAPAPIAKVSATKQVKHMTDKVTSPSKADDATVVAKTN